MIWSYRCIGAWLMLTWHGRQREGKVKHYYDTAREGGGLVVVGEAHHRVADTHAA